MRNFVWIWSFSLLVFLVGCGNVSNPLNPTAASSRISSGGGAEDGVLPEEGTVIFNTRLEMSSGGLVNPIPLLDRGQGSVQQESAAADDVDVGSMWPDEIRDSADAAPEPDDVQHSTAGTAPEPDAVDPVVVDDSVDDDGGTNPVVIDDSDGEGDDSDDGLTPEVIDDDTLDVEVDLGDDEDIWGEVID